MDIYS
jgi:acyl-lipid omega-6 desaturase (Delta-12 desaturase)